MVPILCWREDVLGCCTERRRFVWSSERKFIVLQYSGIFFYYFWSATRKFSGKKKNLKNLKNQKKKKTLSKGLLRHGM